MSATFSNPPSPAPLRPLAIAMVAAAVGHMLFIDGLPRLSEPEIDSVKAEVMETRIIMAEPRPIEEPLSDMETLQEPPAAAEPPPPPPEPAPAPPPEPVPPPPPAPTPAPAPEAAPTPAPPPEIPPPPSTVPPETPPPAPPPAETAPSPIAAPATAAPAQPSLRSLSEQATLIEGNPKILFGGIPGTRPVDPMLTGQQTETALKQMAQAIEGRAKFARPTDLTYETHYQRNGVPIVGRSALSWRHDGRYYNARWAEINARAGNNSYRSAGALAPQGLVPVTGLAERPPRPKTTFDYGKQQVQIGSSETDQRSLPFSAGTQDPISALLHLGGMIAGQPERFPLGTRIRVPVLQGDQTREWVFTVEAQTTLKALKDKDLPVIHLVHTAGAPTGGSSNVAPQSPASAASASAASASAAQASASAASPASLTPAEVRLGGAPVQVDAEGPDDIARFDLWLGPTVDFFPVQWRIQTFNGNVTQHLLRSAIEQKVLQSLPPPRDHLPGQAPPPAAPASAPPPPQQVFPESGGG